MVLKPVYALSLILLVTAGCLEGHTSSQPRSFSDLGDAGVRIAVCDPGHCPAGRYAYAVLTNIESMDPDLGGRIRQNIATNDPDVRAVLDKVLTGEVDAGFVYITDAELEGDRVSVIEIPTELAPLPQYGIAAVKGSSNPDAAALFIDFVLSEEGQSILVKHGFLPAVEDPQPFTPERSHGGGGLTIYAAASLTDVFREMAERFEEETGIKSDVSFGSSGIMRQKIEAGAPADLYASASIKHIDTLITEGFADGYEVFARNRLVVVTGRR